MNDPVVLSDVADGVLSLTLNRPSALNAFTRQMHRELADGMKQAERDSSVRVVLLTGAGRGFCAGQDLREVEEETASSGSANLPSTLRSTYNPLVLRMRALEKPIVAAINGVAAGAGFSLALGCDLRFAADTATFTTAFGRIGLVPDAGGMFFLPRIVGLSRALELAWTARTFGADEAARLGLVDRVVAAESLLSETRAFAAELARGSGTAIGLTKRGMLRSQSVDLETMLDYEAGLQDVAGRGEDFREGMAAFREKRPPHFSGS
jgi:2-(1,2-epoxy-1,2-dihydrophenyl)acetyl-CoA isomerase